MRCNVLQRIKKMAASNSPELIEFIRADPRLFSIVLPLGRLVIVGNVNLWEEASIKNMVFGFWNPF